MRYLSIKALIVLVVLPPVLYVTAIQGLERYLTYHYRTVLQNAIPGDTQALLSGRTRLSDHIQTAVNALLANAAFRHHGVRIAVERNGRRTHGQRPFSVVRRFASRVLFLLSEARVAWRRCAVERLESGNDWT